MVTGVERLHRAAGSFWLRAAVTLALLGVVALQVDWRVAAHRLGTGEWGWFAAAVGLLVAALGVGAMRWHVLLHGAGIGSALPRTLRAYSIGIFSNNFLPTSFGGDAARAWIVGRSGPRLVRALTSVAVDRMSGLACLVLVGWVALAFDPGDVPRSLTFGLLAATAAGTIAAGVLVLAFRGGRGLARRLPRRVRAWGRESHDTLAAYARDRRLVWTTLALGVAFQALTVTAVWFLARSIELDLAFGLVAVTVPLVLVVTLVPISIAGFGLREGGFVVLLAKAGVGATDATLLSLLSVAALAVSSLPGALALLLPWTRPPPASRLTTERNGATI
jgi:uncharacterized membrane protein YbhN (UPF0104 family)